MNLEHHHHYWWQLHYYVISFRLMEWHKMLRWASMEDLTAQNCFHGVTGLHTISKEVFCKTGFPQIRIHQICNMRSGNCTNKDTSMQCIMMKQSIKWNFSSGVCNVWWKKIFSWFHYPVGLTKQFWTHLYCQLIQLWRRDHGKLTYKHILLFIHMLIYLECQSGEVCLPWEWAKHFSLMQLSY